MGPSGGLTDRNGERNGTAGLVALAAELVVVTAGLVYVAVFGCSGVRYCDAEK